MWQFYFFSFTLAMKRSDYKEDNEADALMEWVSTQILEGSVPRLADVVHYAHYVRGWTGLTKKMISARLQLEKNYLMSWPQQRPRSRGSMNRQIHTTSLGHLHADIGFFGLSKHYETPVTYRTGFLVAKDILSRYLYVVPLRKTKSAQSLISAFSEILQIHKTVFGTAGHKIKSVSFDQERSVLSNIVQDFFEANNIQFHKFQFSSSKAKIAEGAIKIIRTTLARLAETRDDKRWWVLLPLIVKDLNSKEIIVNGKRLGFSPEQINSKNLSAFVKVLHKVAPKYYWAQFALNPQLVKFKFQVEDYVRPKLIVTSSAVIGEKRSATSLEKDVFVVRDREAHVSGGYRIVKSYKCEQLNNPGHLETFDETDIVLTVLS